MSSIDRDISFFRQKGFLEGRLNSRIDRPEERVNSVERAVNTLTEALKIRIDGLEKRKADTIHLKTSMDSIRNDIVKILLEKIVKASTTKT